MTECLLYLAPIALIGLMSTEASAVPAAWSGSLGRNIATMPMAKEAQLVLVRRGGGGGGGCGGGGASASLSGVFESGFMSLATKLGSELGFSRPRDVASGRAERCS